MLDPDKKFTFTKEQWEKFAVHEGEVIIGEDLVEREVRLDRKREYGRKWRAVNSGKIREYGRKWRAVNSGKMREYSRKWGAANPGKIREKMLRNKYGITQDIYERMLAQQGGKCYLCEKPPSDNKPLFVDHCHTSGHVRGLLCNKCNSALGTLENQESRWMQKALGYIEAHKERFLDD